jgi:hypothetical protein
MSNKVELVNIDAIRRANELIDAIREMEDQINFNARLSLVMELELPRGAFAEGTLEQLERSLQAQLRMKLKENLLKLRDEYVSILNFLKTGKNMPAMTKFDSEL